MPGFDGTGPAGAGPMTGRGMGYCAVPVGGPAAPAAYPPRAVRWWPAAYPWRAARRWPAGRGAGRWWPAGRGAGRGRGGAGRGRGGRGRRWW